MSVVIRDIIWYDGFFVFFVEGLLIVFDDEKYMNYDCYIKDLKNLVFFNGNVISMGGNGLLDFKYIGFCIGIGMIKLGGGGGCVVDGFFIEFVFFLIFIYCYFRYLISFFLIGI